MAQIGRMPFRGSATLGRGVNTLTGEIVGKALTVKNKESAVTGAEATYDVQIIESHDSLMESLGLSIEASGRYGMFSAEGKFSLSEKSKFNAQSTFVVASCRVQNAFEQMDNYEITPEAKPYLEDKEKFKTAFGTHFVRGLQTGGEFYAVFQSTSTSQETQSSLSASFQAACQGLIASVDFKASYEQAKSSTSSKTNVSILTYQKAGQDEQLSYVHNPEEIFKRLKDFPAIARANPGGYEIEYADYNTLALPQVNDEEIANRELSLNECARFRLKYMTRRNDIDFARENREFFADLPSDKELEDMFNKYSEAVALVQKHAIAIAGRKIEPTVFVLPDGFDLPIVNFNRVNVPRDIPVPVGLIGNTVENAVQQIKAAGLVPEMNWVSVGEKPGVTLNVVTSVDPLPGTKVQPQSRVRLTANQNFNWAVWAATHIGLIKLNLET